MGADVRGNHHNPVSFGVVGALAVTLGGDRRTAGALVASPLARAGSLRPGVDHRQGHTDHPVNPVHYLTIKDIARQLNVPRHRVVWVIASREIRHACQVGEVHGYTDQAVQQIAQALRDIDSQR